MLSFWFHLKKSLWWLHHIAFRYHMSIDRKDKRNDYSDVKWGGRRCFGFGSSLPVSSFWSIWLRPPLVLTVKLWTTLTRGHCCHHWYDHNPLNDDHGDHGWSWPAPSSWPHHIIEIIVIRRSGIMKPVTRYQTTYSAWRRGQTRTTFRLIIVGVVSIYSMLWCQRCSLANVRHLVKMKELDVRPSKIKTRPTSTRGGTFSSRALESGILIQKAKKFTWLPKTNWPLGLFATFLFWARL